MRIGILGATGPAGSGLAAGWGTRTRGVVRLAGRRQGEGRGELNTRWGDRVENLHPCDNAWACDAPVVILAVHADSAIPTVHEHAERLQGKIVVSMANNLVKHGNEFNAVLPPHGSVAAEIQALLWRSHVCTAFHLVPAAEFADLEHTMESDVVVLGDQDDAGRRSWRSRRAPEPAPPRRRLTPQRGGDGDVRGGAAHGEHSPSHARQPASHHRLTV